METEEADSRTLGSGCGPCRSSQATWHPLHGLRGHARCQYHLGRCEGQVGSPTDIFLLQTRGLTADLQGCSDELTCLPRAPARRARETPSPSGGVAAVHMRLPLYFDAASVPKSRTQLMNHYLQEVHLQTQGDHH